MTNRLAIEIGGTKLQAGIGTPNGEILQRRRCAVPRGVTSSIIRETMKDLVHQIEGKGSLERVVIGFGGPVDTEMGTVIHSFQVEGWDGFPLRVWAEEQFNLPCVIENDTNLGALAEARIGAGAGAKVIFYTNVGSGIGGGLVIDGALFNRPFGVAEIGHTKIWDPAAEKYVDVEDLCSGWSIERKARELTSLGRLTDVLALAKGEADDITSEHLGRAAKRGDAEAITLITDVAEKFAVSLCNVIALLNPDTIVVGGGISLLGETFFRPLRTAVKRGVFNPFAQNYEIVPSRFGETCVLVGALLI